jgi:virginiamycin B lyase
MYRQCTIVVVAFVLASFLSSNSLCIFNLSHLESAFAIPTDQTEVVLSTWAIPTRSANTTSIMSDNTGNVYFVGSNASEIGRLVPTTNTFTEWFITGHPLNSSNIFALPAKPGKLTGVALDPNTGNIYFGESKPNKIGMVDVTANTFTEWTLPAGSGKLTGVALDPNTGNVYFGESNPNKIGRFVPKTNTFSEWTLPANSGSPSHNSIAVVPVTGNTYIYFGESNPNKIGRLVSKNNTLTEYALPANSGSIFSITPANSGSIYFAESNSNKIGAFDPTINTFTEYALPVNSGKLTGVAPDPNTGSIYFGESNPNKIGRLVLPNTFTEWSITSHPLAITASPGGSLFFADRIGRLGRFG